MSIMLSPGVTMRRRKSYNQTRRVWTINQRIKFLVDSFYLYGEEYGVFLRQNGLYSHDVDQWREQMKNGLSEGRAVYKDERNRLEARIKELELELEQTKALVELQKKILSKTIEEEKKLLKK